MSKPPPPRYRIVERDGRLITIDTWAKGSPSSPVLEPPPPPPSMRRQRGTDGPRLKAPRPARAAPDWLDAIGDLLVSMILQTRDEAGRRLLTTGPSIDKRGPRVIALSATSERRVGRVLAVVAIVAAVCLIAALTDINLFLIILVLGALVASSLGTVAQAPVTRFLDSLDDDLPH